ncbi:MAG: hypothetical protein J5I59_01120 [Saprospiraceae bacterium]|nr:hypothetical protein [Saprospiraceae bacterium]
MMFIFVLMTLMSMGCTKEPMPSPCKLPDCSDTTKWVFDPPDSMGVMPVLWYKLAHGPDTSGSYQWCFATEDGVVLVNEYEEDQNVPYVRFLDRETGEEKWYWDGIKTDSYSDIQFLPDREILMVKDWRKNAVLDVRTGKEMMNVSLPSVPEMLNSPQGRILGNYFFTFIMRRWNNSIGTTDYSFVMRTRIDDGLHWDTLYTLNDYEISGYTPDFSNVELWMHPQTGDSIILINNRLFHWENYQKGKPINTLERSDVIAYNLSKRKVEWTIDSICKVSQLYEQFHIVKNSAFFSSNDRGTAVINLLNGKIIKEDIPAGIHLLDTVNNELIGRGAERIYRFDEFGNIVKSFDFPDYVNLNGMELFEGYLYFSSYYGDLYVVNATTGKIVFQHFSIAMFVPQSVLGMRGRASVDRKHRLLYCSDLWGTYCLKIPDKWE